MRPVRRRETYEVLSGVWPGADGPYAELINPIAKCVASRTLRETQAVAALKEQLPGPLD